MSEDSNEKGAIAWAKGVLAEPFVRSMFSEKVNDAADAVETFNYGGYASDSREREFARSLGLNETDLELTYQFHSGTMPKDARHAIQADVKAAYRRIEEAVAQEMGVSVIDVRRCIKARSDVYDWKTIADSLKSK